MTALTKLESTLEKWHAKMGFNLPVKVRQWIACNVWWIVIIGIAAAAATALTLINAMFWGKVGWIVVDRGYFSAGINLGHNISNWILVAALFAALIIQIRAVPLLKEQQKTGWDLLFLALVVEIAGSALSVLLRGYGIISSLISLLVSAVIAWFLLFEIRKFFVQKHKNQTKTK